MCAPVMSIRSDAPCTSAMRVTIDIARCAAGPCLPVSKASSERLSFRAILRFVNAWSRRTIKHVPWAFNLKRGFGRKDSLACGTALVGRHPCLPGHALRLPKSSIEGAAHGQSAPVEDMGVNHRGPHVFVAEEFLDGSNVVAGFEQMRSEAMSERVAASGLSEAGQTHSVFFGALGDAFVYVVAVR